MYRERNMCRNVYRLENTHCRFLLIVAKVVAALVVVVEAEMEHILVPSRSPYQE